MEIPEQGLIPRMRMLMQLSADQLEYKVREHRLFVKTDSKLKMAHRIAAVERDKETKAWRDAVDG